MFFRKQFAGLLAINQVDHNLAEGEDLSQDDLGLWSCVHTIGSVEQKLAAPLAYRQSVSRRHLLTLRVLGLGELRAHRPHS